MGMVSRRELAMFCSFQPVWKKYDLGRLQRTTSNEQDTKKRPPSPPDEKSPESRESLVNEEPVQAEVKASRRSTRKKAATLYGNEGLP